MAEALKLWSPTGDCQLALTSGHTFIVPGDEEGAELPAVKHREFMKQALTKGCLPVGTKPVVEPEDQAPDRNSIIKAKMEAMLSSDDPEYFTGDGIPVLSVLSKMCGFDVTRKQRDTLWKEIESEA